MFKRNANTTALHVITVMLTLVALGLICLATHRFTYYDNGRWVQSNLLLIYCRSAVGYGSQAINDRRLPPNWGPSLGYATRNFALDLTGLDYSLPLTWEDIAAGPGLVVMRLSGPERRAVAIFPTPAMTVKPGEKAVALIRLVHENAGAAYSATLYRPRFSSVAYVIEVNQVRSAK